MFDNVKIFQDIIKLLTHDNSNVICKTLILKGLYSNAINANRVKDDKKLDKTKNKGNIMTVLIQQSNSKRLTDYSNPKQ